MISENTTSALAAIQVLLGTPIGNQRLLVLDYGNLPTACSGKVLNEQAALDDLLTFQRLLDTRIELFSGSHRTSCFLSRR